jgi:hypothetical protein
MIRSARQKIPLIFAFVFALALSACNGGCASMNPTATAETPEQHAYALYGQFVIGEEAAAKVNEDAATPQSVREAIAKADNAAKPVADSLLDAAGQVLVIRSQLSQGKSSEEKLGIAITNLNNWIIEAKPLIENLTKAVSGKS